MGKMLPTEPDIMDRSLANLIQPIKSRLFSPPTIVQTGIGSLDKILKPPGAPHGGFRLPSLVLLGAEPKCGKSLFARQIAMNWTKNGGWVFFNDMENGLMRFALSVVLAESGLSLLEVYNAYQTGFAPEQEARKRRGLRWIEEGAGHQIIYDTKPGTPADYDKWLRATCHKADGAPVLLVVDSLNKLPISGDTRAAVNDWYKVFNGLRLKYNCVLLVISELARQGGGKAGYVTHSTAYKESGSAEYTCDLGMTMARSTQRPNGTWLQVHWMRDGDTPEAKPKYKIAYPYIIEDDPV